MPKKHIIFFDVDHTLYSPTTQQVSDSTIEALHALKKRGDVIMVIATGRAHYMLHVIDPIKDLFDAFITINGQIIFVGETLIHDEPMDNALIKKSKTIFTDHALTYGFIGRDTQAVSRFTPYVKTMFDEQNLPYPKEDGNFDVHSAVYQMWAFADESMQNQMKKYFDDDVLVPWLSDGMDVIAPDKNKREGVYRVLSHFNMTPQDAVCFGDGANDSAMLEAMPHSVAMGNAAPAVREKATHVTDTFEADGIAKALRKLGFIE